MAAKIKYSEQSIEAAVRAAQAGGTEKEIAAAVGCTRTTLYRWLKKYPDFAAKMAEAKKPSGQAAMLAMLEERKALAESSITEYLKTKKRVRIEVEGDGNGSFVRTEYQLLPDRWLLERILGDIRPAEVVKVEVTYAEPPKQDAEPGDELL